MSDTRYAAIVDSPIGRLGIRVEKSALQGVDFLLAEKITCKAPMDALSQQVVEQLAAYFKDPSATFSAQRASQGSIFQNRVWSALSEIPLGHTYSYGQLAVRLDSGARAVANACRHNPWPLIIPCHRVVAAKGLGGYAGQLTGALPAAKLWLLRHEGSQQIFADMP